MTDKQQLDALKAAQKTARGERTYWEEGYRLWCERLDVLPDGEIQDKAFRSWKTPLAAARMTKGGAA